MIARFKMAGLHLLGSSIIVGLFLCIVYFIWYPYPYYIFHSVISATKLVVGVDLFLGPLLTFVVFNTAKPIKELKRDLSTIIFVQVLALSWGVHITHSVRPLFAVYFNGEIHSISKVSIDDSGYDAAVTEPGVFQQPRLVYINRLSADEYKSMLTKQLRGEVLGIVLQTHLYRNINDVAKKDMISRGLSEKQLTASHTKKLLLNEFLASNQLKFDDVIFYPVSAGPYKSVVVIDKKTMTVTDLLDVRLKSSTEY